MLLDGKSYVKHLEIENGYTFKGKRIHLESIKIDVEIDLVYVSLFYPFVDKWVKLGYFKGTLQKCQFEHIDFTKMSLLKILKIDIYFAKKEFANFHF